MAEADTINITVHANTELPKSPTGRPWIKSVYFTNCPGDELEFKMIAAVSDDALYLRTEKAIYKISE